MEKISVFEIFKIGIGPSSSHSMGPWNAAKDCLSIIEKNKSLNSLKTIDIELFGSLAKTGKGHGTDKALMMGLMGYEVDTFKPELLQKNIESIILEKRISLLGKKKISFDPDKNIQYNFSKDNLNHPNTLDFKLSYNDSEKMVYTYYSIGGGFIQREGVDEKVSSKAEIPFPIQKAEEIIKWCEKENKSISEISLENEICWRSYEEIISSLDNIWNVMLESIYLGCITDGELPGGLNVKRRASQINKNLLGNQIAKSLNDWVGLIKKQDQDMDTVTNWISCFALAVNEVNASYGRIVTAPTNGAAGVVPATLYFYYKHKDATTEQIRQFLLSASAIGGLIKHNSSISGAEVGCQGEVGSASSMAAAGLCAARGGTSEQIENAAEMALEHHIGMTCDPVKGLVQVPCIERNGFGAVKAYTASSLSLRESGEHLISLDQCIAAMKRTGLDMSNKYKETSLGGLAVSFIEC